MVRIETECDDGTPFPVTFSDPADAELVWLLDREHAPVAMTPLAEAVRRTGRSGSEQAWHDLGIEPPAYLRPDPPRANGFEYAPLLAMTEDEHRRFDEEVAVLRSSYGTTIGVWEEACVPRIRTACARLVAAPATTSFAALADDRGLAWSTTAIAGACTRVDQRAMEALLHPIYGEATPAIVHELATGFPNLTTDAEHAALAGAPTDEHDRRCVSWPIDQPTFAERPDLGAARTRALANRADDHERRARAAEARRQRIDDARDALAPHDRPTFDALLDRLATFVPVREARAHWQLLASGAMRGAVLRRGQQLADAAVIDGAHDVFFLEPNEFDDPPPDARDLVVERRTAHAHWLTVIPPRTIGGSTRASTPRRADGTIIGVGASPGTVTATARVIVDLIDADRLQPGDVLVTTMTAPPWTPLFTIAAAVVTDAGDDISHVAIAAREHAIPCVAGTHIATSQVPDGATITVDGAAGTVTIDRR